MTGLLGTAKQTLRSVCPRTILQWREERYFRKFGEAELTIVECLCEPHRDAIDVGANEGSYIYAMRRHSRRVYAFEPIPWLAARLVEKFGDTVSVECMALSRQRGAAVLHVPLAEGHPVTGLSSLSAKASHACSAYREIPVETRPLDEIFEGDAAFVKIDVEGHEEAVIEGARETIARCRPRLLVEIEEQHAPGGRERIARFLGAVGYRGFYLCEGRLEPIASFDPATMQRTADIAAFKAGTARRRFSRYINNFLFFPPKEPQTTFERIEALLAHARSPGRRAS